MTPRARPWLSLVALQAALAVPLPFSDGFEPPETGFSNWSLLRVNGSNAIVQSAQQARQGSQSLQFTYAGDRNLDEAAAVINFSAVAPALYARLWLYVPAGTEAAMATGTYVRLVRALDSATPDGGGSTAAQIRLNLWRAGASPNNLYLQIAYENASAGLSNYGTQSVSRVTEGSWHYVELVYDAAVPRVRLYIDDPGVPKIDQSPADTVAHALQSCWVGLAKSADDQSSPIVVYIDDVTIGGAPLPPIDGGFAPDAGVPDAGVPDAGLADAGLADAGLADAGLADAGLVDAGLVDAGLVDAGLVDAGLVDAGLVDAGLVDAGLVDAGAADGGPADAGSAVRIVSLPPPGTGCLREWSYQPSAQGAGPLGWALVEAPAGMAIDPASGRLDWAPSARQAGAHAVVLRASGPGGVDEQQFTLSVDCGSEIELHTGCSCGAGPGAMLLGLWLAALGRLLMRRRGSASNQNSTSR